MRSMPEDNEVREVSTRRGTIGESSFDELAKGLASGTITRVQMLKLAGAAVLGTVLGPFFTRWAFADHSGICSPAEEYCGGDLCCGPTEECCYGTCCEIRKTCGADGWCVCEAQYVSCGSECCDPVLETCMEDGTCRNLFCESCRAEGGNCCQAVEGGVLISEACCSAGERVCQRGGEGCLCCPPGTRCPDQDLGEAFVCVSL